MHAFILFCFCVCIRYRHQKLNQLHAWGLFSIQPLNLPRPLPPIKPPPPMPCRRHQQNTPNSRYSRGAEVRVGLELGFRWNFSRVSFLLNTLHELTIAMTFENFCQPLPPPSPMTRVQTSSANDQQPQPQPLCGGGGGGVGGSPLGSLVQSNGGGGLSSHIQNLHR
jgi:hypothetical protein